MCCCYVSQATKYYKKTTQYSTSIALTKKALFVNVMPVFSKVKGQSLNEENCINKCIRFCLQLDKISRICLKEFLN